jgi:hypothetical protein
MEAQPNLSEREVADAINAMTLDILKNTPRIYPKGHPADQLPTLTADVERELKRGRLDEARQRAEIVEKYLDLYKPAEETAVAAKGVIARRVHTILNPE